MNSKRNGARTIRLALVSVCILAGGVLLVPHVTRTHAQDHAPVSMTTDWSNRHMVYSAPSNMAQAWRLQAEPRYLQQWVRRNVAPLRLGSSAKEEAAP
jgi:hypothetical protein